MAISDKLNYLIETKQLFKDRLNSLGAEITSSTTFRNYLTWLDTFYGEVSDKTDLSQNGVVGRTSQESTTGKNLLDIQSYLKQSDRGITPTYNQDGSVTLSGTATTNYSNFASNISGVLEKNKTYTLSVIGTKNFAIGCRVFYNDNTNEDFNITSSNTYVNVIPTKDVNSFRIYMYNLTSGTNYNGTLYFQLEQGSTATSFEKFTYGASPNPDYPQPINNLSGDVPYKVSGKNLFDKNNMTLNKYIRDDGTTLSSDYWDITHYIRIMPNETFTYNGLTTVGTSVVQSAYYDKNKNFISVFKQATGTNTITPPANAYYVRFSINKGSNDKDTFMLEQGSTATSYEPYIEPQTFNIPLKSKNLFDGLTTKGSYNTVTGKVDTTIYNMWRNTNPIGVNPNNDYVFSLSGTALSVSFRVFYYDINKMYISTGTTTNGKFITPADCYYVNWHSTALYTNYPNGLTNAMIEKGSTPTDYEPYYDIELCKIDTYEDKIYSSNGRFYLEKNIDKVVLNGTQPTGFVRNTGTSNWYYVFVNLTQNTPSDNGAYIISSHYKGNAIYNSNTNTGICATTTSKELRIRYGEEDTIANFKNWLSTHNVLVYYVLTTPTTTEITQENYPSLYNALKQIQDYLTAYKINKEFILGYSSPEIEY